MSASILYPLSKIRLITGCITKLPTSCSFVRHDVDSKICRRRLDGVCLQPLQEGWPVPLDERLGGHVGLHLALEARRSARGERSAEEREHCAASRSVARGAKEGAREGCVARPA